MGSLTKTSLLTLANVILQELNEQKTTDVSGLSSGIGFRVLNQIDYTVQRIYRRMGWSYLEHEDATLATTAGTVTYALPDTVNEDFIFWVHRLNHATAASADESDPLVPLAFNRWVQSGYPVQPQASVSSEKRGTPYYYMILQRKLWLWPTPDDNPGDGSVGYSLMIHALQNYAHLTRSNTTTTQLPPMFDEAVVYGSLANLWTSKDIYVSREWERKFEQALDEMISQKASGEVMCLGV